MNILEKAIDSLVPLQLFHLKRLAKPKAQPRILRYSTLTVLLIGFSTFVALYYTQSKSFTTESSIEVSDISNSEWSCSMASVVTQSVTLDSASEPNEYYNLMNINELKSECLNALQSTDPCASKSNILFSSGSASIYPDLLLASVSPASASSNNIFYFAKVTSEDSGIFNLQSFRYDVSSGKLVSGIVGYSFIAPYQYPSSN